MTWYFWGDNQSRTREFGTAASDAQGDVRAAVFPHHSMGGLQVTSIQIDYTRLHAKINKCQE